MRRSLLTISQRLIAQREGWASLTPCCASPWQDAAGPWWQGPSFAVAHTFLLSCLPFPSSFVTFLRVQHLHDNNIIYRDIKPENILLDADGHIKVKRLPL